jgi:hypothetical protein
MRYAYVVQILIEAPDRWHDLCECLSLDAAVAVVRALLAAYGPSNKELKVIIREGSYGT